MHAQCRELQGQALPRALWEVSDVGTRTTLTAGVIRVLLSEPKESLSPFAVCSSHALPYSRNCPLPRFLLDRRAQHSPWASSARRGCNAVRPHVTAAPTIPRALRVWTLQTVCIPHARTMATGGRKKVPVISKEMTCQQNAEKLKKPFPNMETGVDRFGAHGSFCQFFILPVSLADFSTTQHRMKGNKKFYFQYFGALEMIKAFPKK